MTAYELALAVCKALDGKNARDIGIIKVEGRSDITDYFVGGEREFRHSRASARGRNGISA